MDGEPLDEPGALAELIATYEPGDEVELAIRRDGEELTVDAVLGTSRDHKRPPSWVSQPTLSSTGKNIRKEMEKVMNLIISGTGTRSPFLYP